MGAEVAGQGSAMGEQIGTSASNVGGLAVANLKRKEKMTENAGDLANVGAAAKAAEGKMKDAEKKLNKAEDELAVPPEPAPPPGKKDNKLFGIFPNPFGK